MAASIRPALRARHRNLRTRAQLHFIYLASSELRRSRKRFPRDYYYYYRTSFYVPRAATPPLRRRSRRGSGSGVLTLGAM